MSGTRITGNWDDWRWGGQAINPPGGIGAASFEEIGSTGTYAYEFSNNDLMAFHDLQISHRYKEGTDIIPHIHFVPSTTDTYAGTWTMTWTEHRSVASGTPILGPFTATVSFDQSMIAFAVYSFDFSANMLGTNRKISSTCNITLTLSLIAGASCFLGGFDGHYEVDAHGSEEVTSKD